jgi:hypothetical protein
MLLKQYPLVILAVTYFICALTIGFIGILSFKACYRKRLGMLALLNDLTLIGKQNFLKCYKLARINALTALNCKQGWSALGL